MARLSAYFTFFHCAYNVIFPLAFVVRFLISALFLYFLPEPFLLVLQPVNL